MKAVHSEVVSDLTSEGFIAALRRFIGRPNNELNEVAKLLRKTNEQEKIQTILAAKSINWHFIPPLSPNFGGLWAAAVKSFKLHLRCTTGVELLFTFEEFNTLTIDIEAILNSRPLTPICSDPNDFLVLTHGHYLISDSLTSLRERDFREVPTNRLSTWQHIQKVKRDF
ncbi:uncharacterized protein LOC124416197 [Diprion similis]|uniref:uncharacterized protein LOC124416197 n=1 Tax=Diprion similis TaxID=362088 RepID=UPI001EF966A4|nr:uncharacterized protein LOC124416197 [Diprion similis]